MRVSSPPGRAALLAAFLLTGLMSGVSRADVVLSNNLLAPTGGTEIAAGTTRLAASFGTDGANYTLDSVTLRLATPSTGASATLSLFDDGGLQPGSFLGALTTTATLTILPTDVTFTAPGLSLASSSTYWVVLQGIGGNVAWSWANDNTGSGAGFQHTWALSDDAGQTWFSYDIYPTQLRVNASITAVPEPASIALISLGVGGFGLCARRGKRRGPA